ncbi:hypothetical protein [Tenacibaculum sp. UWU-22]|uniref:hypothetical protein n=1 Tax=Tenacibaculum sp. UWU-22 TaxID=3234187 RepID=UPI0034DAE088
MKHGKNDSYTKRISCILTFMSVFLFALVGCKDNAVDDLQPQSQQPEVQSNSIAARGVSTPNYNSSYQWGNLAIGGGGYVTGLVIHPTAPNVMYIRTDVGGAYRWDASKSEWIPMLRNVGEKGYKGAAGIALDKNNPNRVYAALIGGIYRSNDKGATWNKIKSLTYDPNAEKRWFGEPIAVDPNNSDVIYVGTVGGDVLRSLNGGNTWATVYDGDSEIRSIVVNPNMVSNGRSKKVYVAVRGSDKGVFRSSNGGNSFYKMDGTPINPNSLTFQGRLYVTYDTGVSKYGNGTWTDLTPNGNHVKYGDIAVDPNNTSNLVTNKWIKKNEYAIYRSSNGGSSWQKINTTSLPVVQHQKPQWWQNNWFAAAAAAFAFDPHNSGSLYLTCWYGVWRTPNVWANPIDFYAEEKGHEEVVTIALKCPPSGAKVYSGAADVFGFRNTSLTNYPTKRLYYKNNTIDLKQGFDIAYCESQPNNIAYLGAVGKYPKAGNSKVIVSSDYGNTWAVRALPNSGSRLGNIAIASNNPDKMVYVEGGSTGKVYYSKDNGRSWKQAGGTGVPTGASLGKGGSNDVWNKVFCITADAVYANTFYLFYDGYLRASYDGGATWAIKNTSNRTNIEHGFVNVAAAPGVGGAVWVSLDSQGLYKSSNGGKNLTKVTAFTKAISFSWGAPIQGSTFPTAYCFGVKSGVLGLYLSTDEGATWTRADHGGEYLNRVKIIAADRQTFGRVYLGTGGEGVLTAQL